MKSLNIKGTKVYCFDPKYKKYMLMGNKIGDTFIKRVQAKHFFRMANGYGLQYDAYAEFENHGIKKIMIIETENDNTWVTTANTWKAHGKIADYGRGKQIFLSLKYMSLKDKEKARKALQKAEAVREKTNQQMLFGLNK